MRILLDLRWMKPGYTGGIEIQSRAFLNTLLDIDNSNHFTVLIPSESFFDFDLTGHPNFVFINADGPAYFYHRLLEKLHLRHPDPESLAVAGHVLDCDIAISMAGFTHPDLLKLPTLLVVPDIQHEFFPNNFTTQELASRQHSFNTSIQRARTICAISAFTRQTLIDKLQVPAGKILVTPLAADPRITQPVAPEIQVSVLQKYSLKPGYLFYPALTWPHKNHLNLIRGLQLLRDQFGIQMDLVCTGTAKEAQAGIQAAVQASSLADRVHFIGFVPQEDLGSLYRNATALIFPSMFEGFGMPVLEAMACCCPVLCSNAAALPEVAGDAALYFDPQDPMQIAQTVQHFLAKPELRETLVQSGLQRSKHFSWQRFTLQIMQATYCAINGVPPMQLLPPGADWDAVEWQRILFPSQSVPNFRSSTGRIQKSAHRKLSLRWMQRSSEARRQQNHFKSFVCKLGAFLLSPQAIFISRIFPAMRDAFRRLRAGDHV